MQIVAVISTLQEAAKAVNSKGTLKKSKSRLLNAKEVAVRLNCAPKTVLNMRTAGLLKGIKLTGSNKSLRFQETEVEQIIQGKMNHENNN